MAALQANARFAAASGHGMLMHHLYVLEKFHLVVSRKAGRWRRYFQNGGRFGRAVDQIALLQTPPVSLIARTLQEHPGLSQQELLARVRLQWPGTGQSLAYHLRRLEAVGLVRVERRASHAFAWPEPGLAHALSYAEPPPGPAPAQ